MNGTNPSADLRDLIDSRVRLSRLRVLQVVCDHNRELAAVYRVKGRDLLVLHLTTSGAISSAEDMSNPDDIWRRLDDSTATAYIDTHDDSDVAQASNRCCSRSMNMRWLREQLNASRSARRRVVLRSGGGIL